MSIYLVHHSEQLFPVHPEDAIAANELDEIEVNETSLKKVLAFY
jgi:hypothetical protein